MNSIFFEASMDYNQTVEYLFRRLPMFTRIGKAAYKANLDNTWALCKMLGHPERELSTVHVAGTNGKGSTSHMLASVLQEAGYKTGLYTSPHLVDFRERIRINGNPIPQTYVMQFVERYRVEFERIDPSFFEWTVALCFAYFRDEKSHVAVIETGLGGRLDSTNVINPLLSVITNIGWDHTDLLGDTLEKIAVEKAGIIKQGVPAVVGEYLPETKGVFETRAREMQTTLFFTADRFSLKNFNLMDEGTRSDIFKEGALWMKDVETDLGGLYQQRNLLTVIDTITQLQNKGLQIDESHIRKGLARVKQNTGLRGRWDILGRNPLCVCDTAHNVNGLEYVLKQISLQSFTRLHMVIGVVNDKDISGVLKLMPQGAHYYFCAASLPRALSATELCERAAGFNLQGEAYPSVNDAFLAAKRNASTNDMIFVGGSTFVVAEIIPVS